MITLLTDFGIQDAYTGIMKGVIAGIAHRVNVVDICHSISPQDVFGAAYLLSTSYKYFPRGTIHVAVVDPGVGSNRNVVCAVTKDYLFLAPDNGLLSLVVREERPKTVVRVTNEKYFLPSPSSTFHGRDVFAPVAAHLSLGVRPQQLGAATKHITMLDLPRPSMKKAGQIAGQVIYIDRFGNLITNITRQHTEVKAAGNPMKTVIGKKKIVGLSAAYADVRVGSPLVLWGSAGFLEISVNQGDARKYFQARRGSAATISFLGNNPARQ